MVCTTVTVVQQKPIVSGLTATARANQQGFVDLAWTQDIAGNITITVDAVNVSQGGYAAGANTAVVNGLSVGSHSICVAAT